MVKYSVSSPLVLVVRQTSSTRRTINIADTLAQHSCTHHTSIPADITTQLGARGSSQNQYVARQYLYWRHLTDSLSLHKSVALAMTPGPLSLVMVLFYPSVGYRTYVV